MSFTTIWLGFKTSKSFLLLLIVALLFAACRREDSNLDLSSKKQDYQIGGYYTDTFTVKASTVYVRDTVISSTGYLMCGAYHDPEFGNVYNKSFTQIQMASENVDYTGAVVNSVTLRLNYGYGYGDTLQDQTFDVYELAEPLGVDKTLYTFSPDALLGTHVGSATFQARPNTPTLPLTSTTPYASYIDITLDNSYGQKILEAATTWKTNNYFIYNIYGLAIVPRDQDKGAVVQILFSANTLLGVNYTMNGIPGYTYFNINGACTRYFTVGFDRSSTVLSSLTTNYSELPSTATGGNFYMQSMTGLKVRVSFPYIKEFLVQAGKNVLVNKAVLYIPITNGSNSFFKPASALALIMTDVNGQILKDTTKTITRYVQSEFSSAVGMTSTQVIVPDSSSTYYYSAYLDSYFLANQLNQLPYNRSLLVSPFYNSLQVNRTIVNAADLKLKVYYTILD